MTPCGCRISLALPLALLLLLSPSVPALAGAGTEGVPPPLRGTVVRSVVPAASGSPMALGRSEVPGRSPSASRAPLHRLGRSGRELRAPSAPDLLSFVIGPAEAPSALSSAWTTPVERALLPPASFPGSTSLETGFAGLGGAAKSVIPPDTIGAAGPDRLVTLLNSEFAVFRKDTGALVPGSRVSLESFWSPLVPSTHFLFDPRILYDPHSGRFVAITLDGKGGPPSLVLLAVSAGSDPAGTWKYWAIDAELDNNAVHSNLWADYPALGVDNGFVYVTTNRFDALDRFQGVKAWAIPKGQLTASSPPEAITLYEFVNPVPAPPSSLWGDPFSLVPAQTYGTPGAEYVVDEGYYNRDNPANRYVHVSRIAPDGGGTPVWTNLGYVQVPTYPNGGGSWSIPEAPQYGSDRTVDAGDTRMQYVVCRAGRLYMVHGVPDGSSARGEVAWYVVDPSALPGGSQTQAPLLRYGRIRHSSRSYFFPSLAVNASGDAAFGFSGSSPSDYVGAWGTTLGTSDPSGSPRPVVLLKAGEGPYCETLSGTRNRWGDFSATCLDPSDNTTFWTLQEYANTPDNTWGTWWSRLSALTEPAPGDVSVSSPSPTSALVSWTLAADASPAAFRLERRTFPGGDFSPLAAASSLPPASRSFTDNTVSSSLRYEYRVAAVYGTGDALSAEVVFPPPASGGGGGGGCSAAGVGSGAPWTALALAGAFFLRLLLPARKGPGRGTGLAHPPGKSAPPR